MAVIVGGVAIGITYDISRHGWPKASEFMPYVVVMGAFVGCLWGWGFLIRFVPRLRQDPGVARGCVEATSLAWGHCGACGEEIRDIAPDPNGWVVCPACAAAWHSDRWVRRKVKEHDVRHALYGTEQHAHDARGVALMPGVFSRDRWITPSPLEDTSPAVVPSRCERRVMARRAMDRVRERWLLGAALLIACGLLLAGAVSSTFGTDSTYAIAIARMLPIVLVVVVLQVAQVRSSRGYARAALTQGLCPNCGMVLDPSARVEFDGCVSCSHCGRAWKAGDVKQPMPLEEVEARTWFARCARAIGGAFGRASGRVAAREGRAHV